MKEQKNSASEFLNSYGLAMLAGIITISALAIWFDSQPNNDINYENCLKDIAIKECEARGLNYSNFYRNSGFTTDGFQCLIKDNRSLLKVPFKFYDEELERCK